MSASATTLLDDLIGRLQSLDEKSLQEVVEPALKETEHLCWVPNPGPQTMALETEADELFYGGSAGGGKALDLDTVIPTPSGWSTMREISVGDSVLDEVGDECQVLAVSEIMVGRPCYRVLFSDSSVIVADAEHLWLTQDDIERAGSAAGSLRTTKEIAGSVETFDGRLNHSIRCVSRLVYVESVEPVTSRPVKCIQVSSKSRLYLAGEAMIPTHNSDLLIGAALTRHRRALLLREFGKDAKVMAERAIEIRGNRDGFAMSPTPSFRDVERSIDFGGCRDTSEMQRHKGVPYDLFGFDEITDFSETVFRFIKTWNRTTAPGQRCRVICTGNPPTDADGAWIIDYWGPWLDPRHPNPAAPGELRWFTTSEDGKEDVEVDGPGPHIIGGKEVYARSRTYIPAALEDNPDLTRDGQYRRVLDSLSGVFRSAYRDGDFMAAMSDEAGQLIPTWWVMEAQKRWTQRPMLGVPMSAVGADVAQGGADSNVIAVRYDGWYAELIEIPGEQTPVGTDVAPHIITARKNGAPVIIDCGGGYGGSVVKTLRENGIEAIAYKGSDGSSARSRDGNNLKFANKRAEVLWRFREALDPDQPFGSPVALPPDRKLAAELCAFTWEPTASGVRVGSQDKLVEKLGRSPDRAVAVVLCWAAGEHNISYLYSGAGPSAEDGIPGRYGRPGLQKRANVKTRYNRR